MKLLTRILKIAIIVIVVVVLAAGGAAGWAIYSPMPQTSGTIGGLGGLQAPVDVYRDSWGVPHIYADSAHDLFFAQGYVHAQDRFWQMEFWRRIGSGRLSEIFGDGTLSIDRFTRTQGWARVAAEEEKLMDDETRAYLQAYADGVNAYISTHDNLGLEFTVLKLNGANFKPEPWAIVNTLTWAKAMAQDLGGNMDSELENVLLLQQFGEQGMRDLNPFYPKDHPLILPDPPLGALSASKVRAAVHALHGLTGGGLRGIGSNNWVIGGALTDTGKPYLANDPHLGIQMPSIWYEVGLHCRQVGGGCPFNVTGFSFAGAPGVIIGHNDRIAWGMTNLGPDVQDLFIEKINPADPTQYEVNGQWVEGQVVVETIKVKGKTDDGSGVYDEATNTTTITLNVRITRHGPIINDVDDVAAGLRGDFGETAIPASSALALRWTALDPSLTFQSVLKINRARNFDEFRAALREWDVPSQNFVYADVDGNIGYQSPGKIPIRAKGDGQLPAPGWTDEYEWTGFIPFDELPYSFNPPQGYIVTANNAVVGPDYPYLIALDWDRGYRAQRIVDLIESYKSQSHITLDQIKLMQGDTYNLLARDVLPPLLALKFDDPKLSAGLDLLKKWDYVQSMDSAPAALYNLLWVHLIGDTFYDDLPEDLWPGPGDRTAMTFVTLFAQPDSHWWDDAKTANATETRDDILRRAFAEACAEAETRLGTDAGQWAWGKLHLATFKNSTLGRSGVAPIEALFNRGPVETGGGSDTINAVGYRISLPSDSATAYKTYEVNWVPSMRMIVDLSNFDASQTMHTTGQSGHAFSAHYNDMIESWRTIRYHPMLWSKADQGGDHLVLRP
jgi:penicillin amidase